MKIPPSPASSFISGVGHRLRRLSHARNFIQLYVQWLWFFSVTTIYKDTPSTNQFPSRLLGGVQLNIIFRDGSWPLSCLIIPDMIDHFNCLYKNLVSSTCLCSIIWQMTWHPRRPAANVLHPTMNLPFFSNSTVHKKSDLNASVG